MSKRILLALLGGTVLNVVACWGIALYSDPSGDRPLGQSEVVEQLDFIFGDTYHWRQDDVYRPTGTVHTGPLIRRSFVSGWTTEASPRRFSELVLKVGWPFTTVRGFVRRRGVEVHHEGSVPLRKDVGERDEEKILPLQIVWPGLVINSGLLAVLVFGVIQLVRSRGD